MGRFKVFYQLNIKAPHDFILCFGRPGPGDVVDEALKKCDTGEGEYIPIMFSKSIFFYIKITVCVIIKLLSDKYSLLGKITF